MSTMASSSDAGDRRSRAADAFARVVHAAVRLFFAGLMLLPVYGSLAMSGRLAARLAIAGLFGITLLAPEDGLLLSAAFVPLGGVIGGLLGFPSSLREPFALAFLAAWCMREAVVRHPPASPATRALLLPAFLFAAVVAASMVVQLFVQQLFVDFPWPFVGRVFAQLGGRYVFGNAYPGLAPGAVVLEGVGLLAASVVLCSRRPLLARRTLAMAGVAATSLAALSVYRVAEMCLRRQGPVQALLLDPRNNRIGFETGDFNAAGSYFAMMLLLAVGLVLAARRRRWAWGVSGVLILAALWFTGSRAAWASASLSGIVVVAWKTWRTKAGRVVTALGAAGVLLVMLTLVVAVVRTRVLNHPPSVAVATRLELGSAALRMTAARPVFGVGVGRFMAESPGYIDPQFARAYYRSENAHNNFLQILAELGIVGFVPFAWLLVVSFRRMRTAVRARGDAVVAGAGCGLLAFLVSCLTGHPLLIPEIALAFWLALGATAAKASGQNAVDADATRGRTDGHATLRGWLLAAVVGCLALSVPIRAASFIANEADVRSAVLGFSDWSTDAVGARYRTLAGRGQFFVPGNTCEIRVWLRVDAGQKRRAADIELRVDGTLANRFPAVADSWRELKVLLRVDSGKRFRRIELRALPDANVKIMTREPVLAECSANPF